MKELISIVVPIFNVELYLPRCIDSLINQTYKNIDLILVDDGSPDRCGEICENYQFIDHRIQVIHKKNGGLSDARNVGIKAARGNYITFVDSDDWVVPDFIEYLYMNLKKFETDISICNFCKTSTYPFEPESNKKEIVEVLDSISALRQLNGRNGVNLVSAWAKIYKKELFNDILFPIGKIHEDDFISYRIISKANTICISNKIGLLYWQREGSITASNDIVSRIHKLEASIERLDFYCSLMDIGLISQGARSVFHNFIKYEKYRQEMKIKDKTFSKKLIRLRVRQSKQSIFFKLFYEFYFITPHIGYLIYEIIINPIFLKPKYRGK